MSKMPVLFVGHGSPLNAIQSNKFNDGFKNIVKDLNPESILIVSAHWVTDGIKVQNNDPQKTIHDFHGFPKELFEIQYPARGSDLLTSEALKLLASYRPEAVNNWGLDHGAWAVLREMYPAANVPVVQLSLSSQLSYKDHFEIGRNLTPLRSKNVLIIASGNIVHNLRELNWKNTDLKYDWAADFDKIIKTLVISKDFESLISIDNKNDFLKNHPTDEHYIPLLYAIGCTEDKDQITCFNEDIVHGSISMTSFLIG